MKRTLEKDRVAIATAFLRDALHLCYMQPALQIRESEIKLNHEVFLTLYNGKSMKSYFLKQNIIMVKIQDQPTAISSRDKLILSCKMRGERTDLLPLLDSSFMGTSQSSLVLLFV